jgi:hypothetical protein
MQPATKGFFVHIQATNSISASVCAFCQRYVYSPDQKRLDLADNAHRCWLMREYLVYEHPRHHNAAAS